jgi:glycosyltransferase involved in cell wall biosynthesis
MISMTETTKITGKTIGVKQKGESYPHNNPLISIITTTLNSESTIEDTIKSVLNQAYKNIEYLIIDGNSTDRTLSIIKNYERFIDYWVSEPDKGIYDAMNKGISKSHGDWIYFLGSDDILLNIENLIPYLKDNNTIYYGNVIYKTRKKLYDGKFSRFKLARKNISQQAIFYPNTVFSKYIYNLEFPILADWELNIKCFNDKHIKFYYLPFPIAIYNDTHGISSRIKDRNFYDKYLSIINHYFPTWIYLILFIKRKIALLLNWLGISKYIYKCY